MLEFAKRIKSLLYLMICLSLVLSGCAKPTTGTGPGRTLALDQNYKYKIEQIDIHGTKEYEVDVKEIFRAALEKALRDKDLLWDGSPEKKYYGIFMRMLDYEMGNAFKRWLLPTYGATILSVHTDVINLEKNEVITYMEHKQTLAGGGFYSVGAWEYVFDNVAKDIAIDIERKFSGGGEGFYIELDPWLENEKDVPKSKITKNLYLSPFQDRRPEINRIGERHAAFNVSMGDIYANRDVSTYLNEAIQNELLASGNSLSDDKLDITLSGNILKFWFWTDTTALYWDVIGEVELKLTVSYQKKDKIINKVYKAKSESRTYVYPSKELVTTVVSDTVKSLMYDIRKDSIWATF
ncbi:YajG family lipoprotein [Thermodesulfobacteriota bacterium]